MGHRWDERVMEMESKAKSILADSGVYEPPVPIRHVAERVGVEVRPSEFGDKVSGLLSLEDGDATIGYNRMHPSVRQRFTIAHELGHYVLHRGDLELFIDKGYGNVFYRDNRSSEAEYTRELEANAFAASLLMPREMLQREIEKRGFDLAEENSLDELADLFKVSRQAMAYRLANSGIFDSAPEYLG